MAKYRNSLPQISDGLFLSDGGMETSLIFQDGVELPHFASVILLERPEGREQLKQYYRRYLAIARQHGTGFILDTATWRANADWGEKLGYDAQALKALNESAVDLLIDLRREYERPQVPIVINGSMGPRGDGYKASDMGAAEAEDYHSAQIATFAGTEADMVTALTLTNIDEAIGIATAAKKYHMPCVISFTVETNGHLVTGRTLRDAIESVDAATNAAPAYYMINCAHPSHFEGVLDHDSRWIKRIAGLRANASKMSHTELDESDTLDAGDPADLGRRYSHLVSRMPHMRVLGGCCGTDERHIAAICEACLPQRAASA
ncbi:homocysteine methyltransferase [Neorhizobium sp. P12A]|jgi:homocysteine S-methyltransferase|uniref:homocysteine S-methyltransferase family protein n=1 Tax=Neorhizobium sp. P12A TaxID=2268027 RepID=UPI0011F04C0B|nr:homocysteine S-methyltransferase family protein [Neorhizobium sp. P12A]KAA0699899.1 homocysteine methyltransferase [Neorhizobium sp. P12A]